MRLKSQAKFYINLCVILCVLCTLGACGFSPVYGVNTTAQNSLNAPQNQFNLIDIDTISNFEGQYLRNILVDRFHVNGTTDTPLYQLNVRDIAAQKANLDITKTATSTRAQMTLSTTITLIDKKTAQTLFTRDVNAITSYNILGSEFATRVTEQNARENAIKALAQNIETHLALYFKTHQN